jgi:SAM-dependent methyltransferase
MSNSWQSGMEALEIPPAPLAFTYPVHAFRRNDFSMVDFPRGARVVDVGSGGGEYLRELTGRGVHAVGVEPDAELVRRCASEGLRVVTGTAESLPLETGAYDGILCSVVLPYTDERAAVREWGRVLRPGGEVRASYHGYGYALRYIIGTKSRARLYGLRMLMNTWYYRLLGRRLPGWLGDTLCQSRSRLKRYYREAGFELLADVEGKRYDGMPVFLYHHLRKIA